MAAKISKAFEVQRLRVLVAVARTESVSRAAEELGLTQPTVSLHLKALNETLGVPMVERKGRGVRLTEAGHMVERHAARALAELSEAQRAVERSRDLESGSLRVGAGGTLGTYFLPGIIREFRSDHPDVEVGLEVDSSEAIVESILRGDVQIGLVGEAAGRPDLESRPLMEDQLVCVVGSNGSGTPKLGKRDLRESTLLARRPGSATQASVDRWLAKQRIRPAERWELDSPEGIARAVEAGLGVAFVSELLLTAGAHAGLRRVKIEGGGPPRRRIELIRSGRRAVTPPERAFVELLERRLPAGQRRAPKPPAG